MDKRMTTASEHHQAQNETNDFEPGSLGLAGNLYAQSQKLSEHGGSPVDSYVGSKTMTATEPDWIRDVVARHRVWIESVQGVAIEKTVILDASNSFASFAAREILRGVRLLTAPRGPLAKLRREVKSIEYPSGMPPLMRARMFAKTSRSVGGRLARWEAHWGDSPVAIRFNRLKGAIIAIEVPYFDRDTTCNNDVVICRQDEVAVVMEMIRLSNVREEGALYSTGKGFRSIQSSSWDDLVLDENVLRLVKNDYETFFAREGWFRSLKLPFRRGYLLHGPPGNGKTSVIRAMLSRRRMRGLTLNFFSQDVEDKDLEVMFDRAAECAPSMVVLEDIDRAFPKNQSASARSKVSMQQLLNCLDGIGTKDGVVVVATANEPTALDPAILRRPGRFDRVVLLSNPNAQLRLQYLRKLNCLFAESDLETAIDLADGFSFAQMREVYILAGQRAFDRQAEIEPDDILNAVRTLRRGSAEVKERQAAAGFAPARNVTSINSLPTEGHAPLIYRRIRINDNYLAN
jgi:hypothetical protein